jgi:hypothetical protein
VPRRIRLTVRLYKEIAFATSILSALGKFLGTVVLSRGDGKTQEKEENWELHRNSFRLRAIFRGAERLGAELILVGDNPAIK